MSERERPYPMPKEPTYRTGTPKPSYPPEQQYPPEKYPTEKEPPGRPYYPPKYMYDNLDLPKGEIEGYFQAYTLDYDRDPNRVLERKSPWYIIAEWAVIGTAVAAFSGTWHLSGFAESIGPSMDKNVDSEVKLFEQTLDVDSVEPGKKREYAMEITVPPHAIPQDGAFKVVVTLTHSYRGRSGVDHFTRVAGFVEIPMLQFYSFEG